VSTAHRSTNRRFGPHPRRKLTPEQVSAILASVETGPVLAARYGVSHVTIWNVRKRINYREVPSEREDVPRPLKPQPAETPHYD